MYGWLGSDVYLRTWPLTQGGRISYVLMQSVRSQELQTSVVPYEGRPPELISPNMGGAPSASGARSGMNQLGCDDGTDT